MRFFIWWAFFTALLGTLPCLAHGTHPSTLKIIRAQNGKSAVVSVSTHLSELRKVTPVPLTDYDLAFRRRVRIRFDNRDFSPLKTKLINDPANDLITWQGTYHGTGRQIEILERLYPEDESSQLTVALFENGRVSQQATLSKDLSQVVWEIAGKEKTPSAMHSVTESVTGFVHPLLNKGSLILGLLFILGLILLRRTKEIERRN